ncbi:MAG: hypothetical protein JWM10_824 [Myxococcaceae bacterium]|nr:hypothetical protein [Myxococcaceae bacterium]
MRPETPTTAKSTPLAPDPSCPATAVSLAGDERARIPASNHPYRDAKESRRDSTPGLLDSSDLALGWALVAVGVVPVLATLLRGGMWGREPSLGLLLIASAARSLVVHYARLASRAFGRGR